MRTMSRFLLTFIASLASLILLLRALSFGTRRLFVQLWRSRPFSGVRIAVRLVDSHVGAFQLVF